ncbi:MAG TPA: outer membrane lipoprotein chaperone LolA [Terriglobales bacterium]|nr:outer membrane lipoprotein chaperone LolA [Terriglobales bacterium]
MHLLPRRALLALGTLLCLSSAIFAQTSVPKIAEEVDSHYNHLRTLQANFTEIYRGNGISREESGTLWLKRPGKMRWNYQQPRQKLFTSNGKEAWFYVPGEQQARKTPMKKLEDLRSPLGYLLGKTKLQKEFEALSLAPDVAPLQSGDTVLRGVPRFMQMVNQVIMEIGPESRIVRLVVDGADGSTTEYRFEEQKENVEMADSLFQFTPPPGVQVIEEDAGQ